MRRWLSSIRRWWLGRTTVTVTFPPGYGQIMVSATASDSGTFRLAIGRRVVTVRKRWWDTRASVVRKVRRAVEAVL